jgi:two-component system uhpT operon response regulator UhpA
LIQSGFNGAISTSATLQELSACIRTVAEGGNYAYRDPALSSPYPQTQQTDVFSDFGDLSPREAQIALMIGAGLSSPQIATQLSLSKKTVDVHRASIFKKLHIDNRMKLAHLLANQYANHFPLT